MIQKKTVKKVKTPSPGTLFVISAPSGAGKSTLCRMLLKKNKKVKLSVSYTTRAPRKGEVDGRHYSFISERKFKGMINRGEFAEWAMVHGNMYGTSLKQLKKLNMEGYDILLDIDTNGAGQIRKTYAEAVYIFILPPSMNALKKRLVSRETDTVATITKRLDNAKGEIAVCLDYDYIVVNDKLEKAYEDFESIFRTLKLRSERADNKLIDKFLK